MRHAFTVCGKAAFMARAMVDSALHKVNENIELPRVCAVLPGASGRGFYVAGGIRQTKSNMGESGSWFIC